jgi:hypothetical protein
MYTIFGWMQAHQTPGDAEPLTAILSWEPVAMVVRLSPDAGPTIGRTLIDDEGRLSEGETPRSQPVLRLSVYGVRSTGVP